jgi:L-cysteate sulfo-lyase
MQLARFPRRRFVHAPTPLEPLARLGAALGGPTLLVKRDDCTGLALGGNKTRKLEFLVADALAQGADTLVTAGGVQSNHCRQTAAAAARHGLRCELVLARNVASNNLRYDRTGNVLLDRMFGAVVNFVGPDSEFPTELEIVAEAVRARGGRPYVIPIGGSTPIGALGYVACGQELLEQAAALGMIVDAVVHCSGSGGTQAGLLNGLAGSAIPVIGVSCAAPAAEIEATVLALANATAAKLGSAVRFSPADVEVVDDFIGPGYGVPTPDMLEALDLCARLEGLLLDPVYTGKAMAGLIGLVRAGRFKPTDTVIFIHTGGVPALFAYEDTLTAS